MRVVAHEESIVKEISLEEKYGFILLEYEPTHRMVYTDWAVPAQKVLFPYMQCLVCYSVNEVYNFHGFYEGGFRVFFSDKPIENLDTQLVSCPWTEDINNNIHRNGMVCTTHDYDPYYSNKGKLVFLKTFKKLKDLVDFQVSLYLSMDHSFNNEELKEFKNCSLEQVCNSKYEFFTRLHCPVKRPILNFLNVSKTYLNSNEINSLRLYPSKETKIINKKEIEDIKHNDDLVALSLNNLVNFLQK